MILGINQRRQYILKLSEIKSIIYLERMSLFFCQMFSY